MMSEEWHKEIPVKRPATTDIPSDLPESEEELRDYVKKRIECPWLPEFEHVHDSLWKLWGQICSRHQIDQESDYVDQLNGCVSFLLELADFAELRASAINIEGWILVARQEFEKVTQVFKAPMATWKTYPKHFPPPHLSNEQIQELTARTGESLLYPRLTGEVLSTILPSYFEEFFDVLIATPCFRAVCECACSVGASRGAETAILAVESNPTMIHAYPMTEDEVRQKSLPRFSDDSLQGYPRPS